MRQALQNRLDAYGVSTGSNAFEAAEPGHRPPPGKPPPEPVKEPPGRPGRDVPEPPPIEDPRPSKPEKKTLHGVAR